MNEVPHTNLSAGELAPPVAPTAFSFAGVAVETFPANEMPWRLSEEHLTFSGPHEAGTLARLHLAIAPAPELERSGDREIHCRWEGDVAQIRTRGVRAELRRLGPGNYAASALIAPGESGCGSTCTSLSSAIVFREGGLVLHAAAVEIDGQAVVFIGPSGAGKTTAANHCPGARWLARDRAAVYPTAEGWRVAGMCGGDPIDLPSAAGAPRPLGAILRVRHGAGEVRLEPSGLIEALTDLRESVQAAEGADEAALFAGAEALARAALVGRIATVRGVAITPLLTQSLAGRAA